MTVWRHYCNKKEDGTCRQDREGTKFFLNKDILL